MELTDPAASGFQALGLKVCHHTRLPVPSPTSGPWGGINSSDPVGNTSASSSVQGHNVSNTLMCRVWRLLYHQGSKCQEVDKRLPSRGLEETIFHKEITQKVIMQKLSLVFVKCSKQNLCRV